MKIDTMHLITPYLSLNEEFYNLTKSDPLEEPYLISFNPEAAKLIDLDERSAEDPLLVSLLNGTFIPKGSAPFSMAYAGHQFGHYNPWLGDGRAINLGTLNGWNLQTKGSGETLYSRSADGRAAIRSSIREYLMSESMFHLGIATTRAVAIIGSKTKIIRNAVENAAVVMRMSSSWVRFGTFEYFYYNRQHDRLEELAEYVIAESFPHLEGDDDRLLKMFCEVVDKTALLIAQWQGIGFNHGVMNTDNMSIAGLTIDYGPFAMMDDFNFGYICNCSDKVGRYSYAEQPNVAYWNLTMLAKALSPIIPKDKMDKKLKEYGDFLYPNAYINVIRKKIGLSKSVENDAQLVEELIIALHDAFVDYTLFFRTLSHYTGNREALYDIAMDPVVIDKWLEMYDKRLLLEENTAEQRVKMMLQVNPKYVLKNHMLQEAIEEAEKGDFKKVEELLYIASHPYDELPEFEHFAGDTPEEYKNIGLSCSS